MVYRIISLLDGNVQIYCLYINSTWNQYALPQALCLRLRQARIIALHLDDYSTIEQVDILWPFICRNPCLTSEDLDGVSDQLNLQELVQTLRSLSGMTRPRLKCSFQYHNMSVRDRMNKVDFQALGSMIQGLAYSHLQLKNLVLHVHVEGTIPQGWVLFEDHHHDHDDEVSTALFPDLEELSINDRRLDLHLTARVLLLPTLREAPSLKNLSIPRCLPPSALQRS
ncbi:hypothetical protein MVEG_09218 [Podila verticillata NRRL 6337]|nr:hypothetical protein MVEG_09218 [Podila verticillata NRRL 6337]